VARLVNAREEFAAPYDWFLRLPFATLEAYALRMTISARNRLEGKVIEIQYGGVMAHVVVRVGKNVVESVITKRSADEMKLKVGDRVAAVIKSTEVMLEKD
jgi:molybdopterin-binding protein